MKVMVTGAAGMLAQALVRELESREVVVAAFSRRELDVSDREAVLSAVVETSPDALIQCAAYTAVDAAEDDEIGAFRVNAQGTRHVAEGCQRVGALLVYPSTDYVFGGRSDRPYQVDDPVAPLGAYGRTKAAGEDAARTTDRALIVRTSWLYGAGGRNFVDTIRRMARQRARFEVVHDQVGLPTWTASLSSVIARLLKVGALGTFHASDGGEAISWHEFARKIVAIEGLTAEVVPVSTEQFGARAPRPEYSDLDCSYTEQILGEKMRPWEDSLTEYLMSVGAT